MAERSYDPSSIEPKWQRKWADAKAYEIDLKKAKDPYYGLVMFPYPSGDKLHVGHWYNYAPADSYFRYQWMHGKDVFTPMGFDAFGLPAENYAIKTGVPPAESTAKNVETMIRQLSNIGCMYDWSKTLNTSNPEYYRWTQWLFLQMFKNGLAYRKLGNVNWCPKDQTVLANEQVWDGKCERCGTEVVQKALEQWYWKITQYAETLLNNLDNLDWPEKTKIMQRNWIGKSEGAEIKFPIALEEHHKAWEKDEGDPTITVFTTRPDTLFGVTYMVLAPEHPLVDRITPTSHREAVHRYREEVKKKTEMQRTELSKDKTGVWTGAYAINPANRERIQIWIADYALMTYGTGAVMAVPGHDERDYAFAKKFKLPIGEVVSGGNLDEAAHTGEGKIINSDFLNGLSTHEAKKKIIAWVEDEEIGQGKINYRLRDWLVSRQRYWGAPIPIVYDPEGNPHPVPEKHLPWLLPTDVEFKPTGESPLVHSKEFKDRTEKIFGKGWRPEYDTMDTFVCSSFYYLRFLSQNAHQKKSQETNPKKQKILNSQSSILNSFSDQDHLIDPTIEKKWMPIDTYIGGPEHACMHLIYARFVMMALKDFGFVSHEEPFKKLVHQGLITHKGAKMSKSKGNVVSPDDFVTRYGSDVFRMYLMFMGPFEDGGDWSDAGIKGIDRFVQRLYGLYLRNREKKDSEHPRITGQEKVLHMAIKRVTESIERLHFNTAISALMELLNHLEKDPMVLPVTEQTISVLLAPLAPHLAEELWEMAGGKGFVIDQKWPTFDPKLIVADTMTIAVQVNGKLRATLEVPSNLPQEEIIKQAKAQENVRKYLEGKEPKKEIYVKGKLVSLVV